MNKELILEDSVIKELLEYFKDHRMYCVLDLVGGAVVDLLEGRKPKDYDIIGGGDRFKAILEELGYMWKYETKTSSTYVKNNITIQILKTKLVDFDFKISQSKFSFTGKNELTVDKISFEKKVIIPTSFEDKGKVINSLKRKLHWEKKGYTMPDETYLSLCNVLYNTQSNNS